MSQHTPVLLYYSRQRQQLDHILKNHLTALKPPSSNLTCNIFNINAARASYKRNEDRRVNCSLRARQQLQGAALLGGSDRNLPLLMATAMAWLGQIASLCGYKQGNYSSVFTRFTFSVPTLSIFFSHKQQKHFSIRA